MASSQVTKPIFPVEVWSTVFSNFKKDQDLVHLWTDCRHVCRQFRDDVERIFISKHLKKTTIDFDCGVWYNEEAFGGKVNLRSISFGFDRFTNEGKTAVFKIEDCAEEYISEIMRRVLYRIDAESTIESPGHLVYLRRLVNDTEVPDLAVDARSREISFDWRAMFSHFLAEQKLSDHFLQQNLFGEGTEIMSKGQEVREKVDRGEMDMYESLEAGLTLYSRALDESSMSARRARIRRQWEAEGQDWVIDKGFEREEKRALATLKEARFMAGFQEFSDDEGEDEAESGSRSEKGTANEAHEDDDEDTVDGVEDDQDIDDDRFLSDDEEVEEGEDVNDDEDVEEKSGDDVDNEGGVVSGHQQEN